MRISLLRMPTLSLLTSSTLPTPLLPEIETTFSLDTDTDSSSLVSPKKGAYNVSAALVAEAPENPVDPEDGADNVSSAALVAETPENPAALVAEAPENPVDSVTARSDDRLP
jgi:hypothetical protein